MKNLIIGLSLSLAFVFMLGLNTTAMDKFEECEDVPSRVKLVYFCTLLCLSCGDASECPECVGLETAFPGLMECTQVPLCPQ